MRREFSAGGVVVRRMRGRWWVALVRPRRDDEKVVWALPKGLIDDGERSPETAVREAFEETGVRAVLDRKLGDVRYVYTWQGERIFKIVSFYLFRYRSGRLGALDDAHSHEVAEARWLPLEQAPQLLSYRGEQEMARRARALVFSDQNPL